MPGARKTQSAQARENHRRAGIAIMDDPLTRAMVAKATAKSWQDPAIRAKRIAGLRRAWATPAVRKKYLASLARRRAGKGTLVVAQP